MAKWTALLLAILVMATCAAAVAAAEQEKTPVALTFELYMPTNSSTRDVFGATWAGFGLDVLRPQETEKWRPLFSVHGMSADNDGDATIFGINFGMQKAFGDKDAKTQPFVVLRAGPYHGDISVPGLGIDESKWGLNANAEAGLLFNKRFVIKARYDFYSKIGGFSFDGFTFSAGVKLFDIK